MKHVGAILGGAVFIVLVVTADKAFGASTKLLSLFGKTPQ